MASADVSALLDIASAPADPPTVESTVVEEAPLEQTEEVAASEAGGEKVEGTEPGTDEKPLDGRKIIGDARKALKAFRDSSPENAPLARYLNNAVGRYDAYRAVFPKVADAQAAKAMLDAVGGNDGLAGLQDTIKSVNETDSLLYAGDARVIDNLIEDMKRENKLDAFGKLASPFLDKLRETDEKSYFEALRPHFFQGLVDVGLPGMLQQLTKVLGSDKPDLETAKALLGEMSTWFDNLRNSVETGDKSKLDPERQAFERERTEFQTAKQKEFQSGVATACDLQNNKALGTALKSYMKLPFFKSFSSESLIDLGNGLKQRLYNELSADKAYQSQMDAFFSSSSPDRAKIESFHAAKVDNTMSARIVKEMLNTRYPGFAKGTPAAGAAATKKVAPAAGNAAGKPQFVTAKPKWEEIDWDRDPAKMLYITGRGYLKRGGQFVTWNQKYR